MIEEYLLIGLAVAFSVMILVMVGQKLRIAYPIFLTIAGLGISFIPQIPVFQINPDIVFLIFLPPILFHAAWNTSWKEFLRLKRPILGMAFGLVFLTSIVVATLSSSIIPGITLAMGFLLGGINSPPDAVAATSILKNLKIPKRTLTILEGESLINDASSLIVFKFAVAAVMTGQFLMKDAVGDFFIVAIMGIVVGVVIAYIAVWIFSILPTSANIDTVFTLLIPYVMYVLAEHYHFSGVLAVVAGGLVMSYKSDCYLTHTARLQSFSVWNTIIFALNAFIFVLIGLQLPVIIKGMTDSSIKDGLLYAVIIGAALVLVRFIWTYTMTYVPRLLSKKICKKEAKPNWREPFILSISAMRGVVSLAGALAIPLALPSGEAFPHRNIIIFVTFAIILFTLVGQGLLLPLILKYIDIKEVNEGMTQEEQEIRIKWKMKRIALHSLTVKFKDETENIHLITNQKVQYENDLATLEKRIDFINTDKHHDAVKTIRKVQREIIKDQRELLKDLKKMDEYDDEVIRKLESILDLEELKITGFQLS